MHASLCAQSAKNVVQTVQMELFGAGGFYALNYIIEYNLPKNIGINARVGITPIRLKDFDNRWNPTLIAPLHLGISKGIRHKIFFNLGIANNTYMVFDAYAQQKKRYAHFSYFFMLGYEFNINKRIALSTAINPIYTQINNWQIWPSFGFSYKL